MKSVSKPKTKWTTLLTMFCYLSLISSIIAAITWLLQYNLYLKNNILIAKDQLDGWYSKDLTTLGYGFYIVIVSILITSLNAYYLNYIRSKEKQCLKASENLPNEEKSNGDIMLY